MKNEQRNRPTRIVVAIGGNALENKKISPTAESQRLIVAQTAEYLAELSQAGYEMAIVHGNGPQVGRILLASEGAKEITPVMPLDVCGAMSQGYIGYHIQQALTEALQKRNRQVGVVSLVTQTVVDANDSAFSNPTKPIGPFYTQQQAEVLIKEKGYTMKEDAGRGYRRVVPSPKPKQILEVSAAEQLWEKTISILCGGGGVPVIRQADGSLKGIEAVIDKDLAAAEVAIELQADILMILTEVEYVYLHWNQPNQEILREVPFTQMEEYLKQDLFAAGSMRPKVEAAVEFVRSKEGRKAVITSLDQALAAMQGKTGTWVI